LTKTSFRRPAAAADQQRFIAYYRVSTDKQGVSGLGLEAQRQAVARHVAGAKGIVVADFTEIETGTNKRRRPQMAAALAACRLRRATLVIAKLDRLARNVHFISGLMESNVDFVACDNPHASRVLIHIMAAFAEHEAEMISRRTKDALAAAKARGAKLGNPHITPGDRFATRKATRARITSADAYAADVQPYIDAAKKRGCSSLRQIADALTAGSIETPGGRRQWSRAQVSRIIQRNLKAAIT
jgi:DNA invertase Pin-like site-specific DNA recombinase